MRRAVIIYNPIAGSARGREIAELAEARLLEAGLTVETISTRDGSGATEIARQVADRTDLLVIAGGDGSLREALEGLGEARQRVVLAFLPIGNANVAAQELGIPNDPLQAIALLDEGVATQIDLGLVELDGHTELFLAMVGVGWDAITVRYIQRIRHNRLGQICYRVWADAVYVLCGLLSTLNIRPPRFRVSLDGEDLGEGWCAAHFCNFRAYGKGMSVAPEAHHRNGRLHFQVRRSSALPGLLGHLVAARLRRRAPARTSKYGAGERMVAHSQVPLPVQTDGDFKGEFSKITVRVLPDAARILASRNQGAT
jgi:diacylglycerol kinase (ATP)